MTHRIQELDTIAECRLLTMGEWEERIEVEDRLEALNRSEELYWKQKAGNKWLLEGDSNTNFFHQFANGRRRKKMIIFLESDSREIRGQKEITDHIVDFYKTLFIPSNSCAMHLKENFCPSHMQLNESEKIDLVKLFGMDDVKGVVMDMKVNTAPGLNGFSTFFFQKFWDTIYRRSVPRGS